jgi:precorrin-6A/cobalt-precorrin-6A reductase
MILLLGGTSDTRDIAQRLADRGMSVLVSTASDTPLEVGRDPKITRRSGPLDRPSMAALIQEHRIAILVDATHPYAEQVRETARDVARATGTPYLTYVRPPSLMAEDAVTLADTHHSAARLAFAEGKPVLLTTGSRNLQPYVERSRETGIPLFARVLDCTGSLDSCREASVDAAHLLLGRGPYDVETNRQHIRGCRAGVIVTKDGGHPSGLRSKLEAARSEGCDVVVVARPSFPAEGVYDNIGALIDAICHVQVSQ